MLFVAAGEESEYTCHLQLHVVIADKIVIDLIHHKSDIK
jgi:hypothetical protein